MADPNGYHELRRFHFAREGDFDTGVPLGDSWKPMKIIERGDGTVTVYARKWHQYEKPKPRFLGAEDAENRAEVAP